MKTTGMIYFSIFLLAFLSTACAPVLERKPDSLEITQTVIVMQQTQTTMAGGQPPSSDNAASLPETLIPPLTEQATLLSQLTVAKASSLPTEIPLPTNTPRPTFTPKPASPLFTTNETMFCRQGPDSLYEAHYTLAKGKTVPVLAKWVNNDWLLVGINDSSTRTKCCWVGGEGSLNVSLSTLLAIDFLPDRIECNLTP